MGMLFRRSSVLALTVMTATCGIPSVSGAAEITVFAAASLKNALDAIAADWQKETGNTVTISYGGSSKLAKQIEQGAPADIFVSAAKSWMDTLAGENLIRPETRKDILGNALVLVSNGKDVPKVDIGKGMDLAGMLKNGKLAMAMIDSVPAGQYGKEALDTLGLWSSVESQVVQAEDVRATLKFVATGEAALGIVYASDAIADDEAGDKVSVVGTFPADSHKPIVYPAAETAASAKPEAKAFLDALSSDAATKVFEGQGFTVLK